MESSSPTRIFLTAAFGEKPEGSYILIWTLPDKRSRWCSSVDSAVHVIEGIPESQEVYFGVGLSPDDKGVNARARATEISALTCIWADVDIQDGVHTKRNLPATETDARKIIECVGVSPSAMVHSGHGLQVFWFLKEPWVLGTGDERQRAMSFSQRFSTGLRQAARELGYEIDSVHDLARIMRVPGTSNNKNSDKPVPVRLVEMQSDRGLDHTLEEFDDFLSGVSDLPVGTDVTRPEPGTLTIVPGAEPPLDKFLALLDNSRKFRDSWNHNRLDLADSSASGHDLSLALFAAQAGWTDQEMVNLLIACRRHNGDDLKLREDYYGLTVAKARKLVESQQAVDQVASVDDTPVVTDDDRAEKLDQLSVALGVKIEWLRMYDSSEPEFRMRVEGREIRLGDVSTVMEQRPFRNAVARGTLCRMRSMSPKKWDQVSRELLKVVQVVDVGEEATLNGQVHSWLEAFLERRGVIDDPTAGLEDLVTFSKGENVFVHLNPLKTWLHLNYGERLSTKKLATNLVAFGCVKARMSSQKKGRKIQRRVYSLPKTLATAYTNSNGNGKDDDFGRI